MSVYAVSDLHGHIELYNMIKDFLKPEDKVICLGDCGDRGPQPWKTIKAVAADPQWEYLLGNHEQMLAGAMCEYLGDLKLLNRFAIEYEQIADGMGILSMVNGGEPTLHGWIADGADPKWVNFFFNLPPTRNYINVEGVDIKLSHAGYTPDGWTRSTDDLIWNREHLTDKWPKGFDNTLIIHGHTPCFCFKGWKRDGAVWYCGGHKIDIDQGTYDSKQALLFDLDTYDEHIFQLEERKN